MATKKNLYSYCYDYLLAIKPATLEKSEIDSYLSPIMILRPYCLEDAFLSLAYSLQKNENIKSIIKLDENLDLYMGIISIHSILTDGDKDSLFRKIKEICSSPIRKEDNDFIKAYAYGLWTGALFLNKYENVKTFIKSIDVFESNSYTIEELPQIIATEILGLGYSGACDWLQRLGYYEFIDPDKDIMDVFTSIGLAENKPQSVFRALNDKANEEGVSPIKMERAIRLISTDFAPLGFDFFIADVLETKSKFLKSLKDHFNE